jgi:hypothetical protein
VRHQKDCTKNYECHYNKDFAYAAAKRQRDRLIPTPRPPKSDTLAAPSDSVCNWRAATDGKPAAAQVIFYSEMLFRFRIESPSILMV